MTDVGSEDVATVLSTILFLAHSAIRPYALAAAIPPADFEGAAERLSQHDPEAAARLRATLLQVAGMLK